LRQWTDAEQVREKLLGAVLGNGEVVDTWGIGLGERLDVPPRRGIDLSCRQGLVKRTPQPGPVSVCSVAPLPVVFSIAGSLPVVLLGTLFGAHTRGLLHEIAICIRRIIGDADLLDLVPLIPEIVADVPMS
jgi:hypothetical protein